MIVCCDTASFLLIQLTQRTLSSHLSPRMFSAAMSIDQELFQCSLSLGCPIDCSTVGLDEEMNVVDHVASSAKAMVTK